MKRWTLLICAKLGAMTLLCLSSFGLKGANSQLAAVKEPYIPLNSMTITSLFTKKSSDVKEAKKDFKPWWDNLQEHRNKKKRKKNNNNREKGKEEEEVSKKEKHLTKLREVIDNFLTRYDSRDMKVSRQRLKVVLINILYTLTVNSYRLNEKQLMNVFFNQLYNEGDVRVSETIPDNRKEILASVIDEALNKKDSSSDGEGSTELYPQLSEHRTEHSIKDDIDQDNLLKLNHLSKISTAADNEVKELIGPNYKIFSIKKPPPNFEPPTTNSPVKFSFFPVKKATPSPLNPVTETPRTSKRPPTTTSTQGSIVDLHNGIKEIVNRPNSDAKFSQKSQVLTSKVTSRPKEAPTSPTPANFKVIFDNMKTVNGVMFKDLLRKDDPKKMTPQTNKPWLEDVAGGKAGNMGHLGLDLDSKRRYHSQGHTEVISPFLYKKKVSPSSQFFMRHINKVTSPSSKVNITNSFLTASPFMEVPEKEENGYVNIKVIESPFLQSFSENDRKGPRITMLS